MAEFQSYTSGGSGWTFVEEKIAAGVVQTLDFNTALDGNTDGAYKMLIKTINGAVATSTNSLRINGATWAVTNEYILANGAVITCATSAGTNFFDCQTSDTSFAEITIYPTKTGSTRFASTKSYINYPTVDQQFNIVHCITTPNTATNITSLGIASSIATGFQAGTSIMLFKRKV